MILMENYTTHLRNYKMNYLKNFQELLEEIINRLNVQKILDADGTDFSAA